jgi:hypothetical protein
MTAGPRPAPPAVAPHRAARLGPPAAAPLATRVA